ncbi:hypothetical protein TYRP_012126 [Tyrophagus putrescentiae]|nr:hypothetical protein TYRP_012126 [Tyrophagus putrescentiae]
MPALWTTSVASRTHQHHHPRHRRANSGAAGPHNVRTIAMTGFSYRDPEEDSFRTRPDPPIERPPICYPRQDRPTVSQRLPSYNPDTNRASAGPPCRRVAAQSRQNGLSCPRLQRLKSDVLRPPARWQTPLTGEIQASSAHPLALIRRLIHIDLGPRPFLLEDISGAHRPTALLELRAQLPTAIGSVCSPTSWHNRRCTSSALPASSYGPGPSRSRLLTGILLWRLIQKATLRPELLSPSSHDCRCGPHRPPSGALCSGPLQPVRFPSLRMPAP